MVAAHDVARPARVHPVGLAEDEGDREGEVVVAELDWVREGAVRVQALIMLLEESYLSRLIPQQGLKEILF